jgi:hypothetical protein
MPGSARECELLVVAEDHHPSAGWSTRPQTLEASTHLPWVEIVLNLRRLMKGAIFF